MRLHAIRTGSVRVRRSQLAGGGLLRVVAPLFDRAWSDWVPTYAWAIEHPDGVIVVDTGAAAHLMALPRWHPFFRRAVEFDVTAEQEIGPQLNGLGIRPGDVRLVVLTHLHIDHDAGLKHFPKSRFRAAAGEAARASGLGGRLLGYLPGRWPDFFDPEPMAFAERPFGPFGTSMALTRAGDVLAVPTPGHTPDHFSVIVQEDDQLVVLAGDASYTEALMLAGQVDGISPNARVARDTLTRLRQLAAQQRTVYLPTHDPESGERLVERRATVVPLR